MVRVQERRMDPRTEARVRRDAGIGSRLYLDLAASFLGFHSLPCLSSGPVRKLTTAWGWDCMFALSTAALGTPDPRWALLSIATVPLPVD